MISDNNLYLLRRSDFRLIKTVSLASLSSILIITENSSIFVLKFEGQKDDTRASSIQFGKADKQDDLVLVYSRRTEFISFVLSSAEE